MESSIINRQIKFAYKNAQGSWVICEQGRTYEGLA